MLSAEPSSSPIAALAMDGGHVDGLHKGKTESIQIPHVKTTEKDDESIASGSTDSQSQLKKRLSADMSKEQVEDLVRKLTIDEMKTRWFDEIFEKVKSELVEEHSPADTPSSSEPPSPRSDAAKPASHESTPRESVREEPKKHESASSSFDSKNKSHNNPSSSRSSLGSPTTSYISDSASSRASNRPERRHSEPRPASRPAPPPEPVKQGPALSAVDLKWGTLFDDRGEPTKRLGQVLRGIANYLISEYSPHNSLVVTPEKLNAFYLEYKLDTETFPFQQIFDCRPHGALDNLETLYQHLRCENHLIQRRPGGMPHIPSLTPAGFERWMTCQLRAFPDQEAKRLNHIMTDLPITADGVLVDDKPERLPKQISRHLLPATRHRETHDLVVDAIAGWIKHTEENESDYRRTSSEDVYKIKEEKSGRYRPDDYREREKYRRGSKDNHRQSPLSSSSRFVSRVGSDSTIRPSKDSPVSSSSSHRARSPVSNRYRHSASAIDSSSSTVDAYDIPSSSHRNSHPASSSRRSRDKEYRYSSSPKSKSPIEATPRILPRRDADRRSSLIFEETGKDPSGITYDEYLRMNQRPMRNAVVDDGGHYRTTY
ncbi:hypothetical protein FOC4_g10006125 [Fusarium odoratissimum]|uniref:DUF7514 domain-containing protein n=1 Tax=Fusarium oxysporum f. sp. cubense (strain race 4) TaxID=2502994 RepID=N1R8I7_FUSC4|nr:hypothetical protein FOC4_g10006125 [Fusarium odoratissimum]